MCRDTDDKIVNRPVNNVQTQKKGIEFDDNDDNDNKMEEEENNR